MRFTAQEIDAVQFRYECPVCSVYTRKDGKPRTNPKRVMHAHGSNGELHNRVEYRSSHCGGGGEIEIAITGETARVYNYKLDLLDTVLESSAISAQ